MTTNYHKPICPGNTSRLEPTGLLCVLDLFHRNCWKGRNTQISCSSMIARLNFIKVTFRCIVLSTYYGLLVENEYVKPVYKIIEAHSVLFNYSNLRLFIYSNCIVTCMWRVTPVLKTRTPVVQKAGFYRGVWPPSERLCCHLQGSCWS